VGVRFEAQVTAARAKGVDHTDTYAGVELLYQFADGLGCCLQEHLQERAVGMEEGPEEVIDGESDVEVGHVEEVTSNVGNPVVDADFATGRTEASFAGERDTAVESTAGADVAGVTGAGVAAKDHTLDGLADVCLLINRDFFEAQIAPGVPVIAEDVAETVVSGGVAGVAPGGPGLSVVEG